MHTGSFRQAQNRFAIGALFIYVAFIGAFLLVKAFFAAKHAEH